MAYTKPIPEINADNRIFWEKCREHVLTLQKCIDCGNFRNPPAFVCPRCLSQRSEWMPVSGKGSIYTFAVYHTSFHPGFKEELPYVTAVVELAEGPRMMSNIVECPPEKVFCGMPVKVTWRDAEDQFSIPLFRPAEDRESFNGHR